MSTTYKTVITDKGAERITAALLPDGEKLKITHFAVGDGNGSTPIPDVSQTALVHEVYRGEVSNIRIDVDDTTRIIVEGIIPASQGGFWVREIGLYDDQGVLVAVCSAPERYKPVPTEGATSVLNCQVYVVVSNTDAIQLKVLDNAFLPDATTDTRGLTILSSDIDSDDETKSATPKAVNDVRKQLPVVATDIRDRTDGRVALPGMFGFGAILTDVKSFSGNAGTSEFLTWVRTATPGVYQVSQSSGNNQIIPGVVFNGLIEIKYISSSRNSSGPQYEEKGIFYFGVNGDFRYNRYHTTNDGYLVGWENLKVDVEALRRLIALKADLNSPVFTGNPRVPTAEKGDSSTSTANTEFVTRAINDIDLPSNIDMIPSTRGYGTFFTDTKKFTDNDGPMEFLFWVMDALPGRYYVTQVITDTMSQTRIIPGIIFDGIVEIGCPAGTDESSHVNYDKTIEYRGVRGELYYNRYIADPSNPQLQGWWQPASFEGLYATTGNGWGSPKVGGLIFAAYFGQSDSDNNRKLKRGDQVPGSRLGCLTISAKASTTGSYASSAQFITVSPNSYPQAGVYQALSGSHLTTLGTTESFVGLFIRVV